MISSKIILLSIAISSISFADPRGTPNRPDSRENHPSQFDRGQRENPSRLDNDQRGNGNPRMNGNPRNGEFRRGRQTGRRGNERSLPMNRVDAGRPAYAGNGCPQDTMRVVFAPDNLSFSILFDQFIAEVGVGKAQRRDVMNCDMIVPIQLPANTQMEITNVDLRGFVNLPPQARSQLSSVFNFRGNAGDRSRMLLNYSFVGPTSEDYELSSGALNEDGKGPTTEVSPCGGTVQLIIRNSLRIVTRTPNEEASATLDSIDGAGHAVYYINWRTCQ